MRLRQLYENDDPLDQWQDKWEGKTFADVINYAISLGEDPQNEIEKAIQTRLNVINKDARERPVPRGHLWTDRAVEDPFKVTEVVIDSGYFFALISGRKYEDVEISFKPGDSVYFWVRNAVFDNLPN